MTLALLPTPVKHTRYTITMSATGTVRITWADGTGITLLRQTSKAAAILHASRLLAAVRP